MDHSFEGDWPALFGSTSAELHSVFRGESGADDPGVVELVGFGDPITVPALSRTPEGSFLLLSSTSASPRRWPD